MDLFWIIFIGLTGGLTSGLFGIGGGTIFVPLLILLKGYDPHVAIGTSIAVIVPTALVAAYRHSLAGMVEWKTVLLLVFFSVAGAWLGSTLSLKMDVVLLKRLFAVLLIVVAFRLFFQN